MKKVLPILLALLIVLATGCSNNNVPTGQSPVPSEQPSSTSTPSGEKVALTFGLWDANRVDAYNAVIKKFNEANPNIEVKIELTPWEQYWMKMEAAGTGGVMPDILWMNGPNFIKYASNDVIQPLSSQIKASSMDMNNYPKALVDLYTYNSESFAIPIDFDTIGLWYNKKLFDEANMPYPDESWDWAKFKDAALKLTNASAGIYGFTADLWGQGGYYNTIYQNGGYVISEDKKKSGYDLPESIEGLKFWTDMIEQKISPTAAQLSETPGVTMFESGKSAMYYGGSWIQAQFAKNDAIKDIVDVTVLPKGKQKATIIHGLGVAMSANTKHPAEVWKFIEYMSSKEAHEILGSSGTMIPAFNGTQEAWINSTPNFNLKSYIDAAQDAVPLPSSKNSAKWQDKEWELFSKAWAEQMTIEDAAKELTEFMNNALKEE